jgi:hypothetical protein
MSGESGKQMRKEAWFSAQNSDKPKHRFNQDKESHQVRLGQIHEEAPLEDL